MGRIEKRRQKKRMRYKTLFGILLCIVLFCCGLSIVDASSRDMLGISGGRPIFGVYDLDGQIIKLEFAGSRISIDKNEWKAAYELVKEKIEGVIGTQ